MQQTNALSPQSRRLSEDTDPRFSLLYRTPRTLEAWRKQDEDQDELLGLYKGPGRAYGSSLEAPSRISCPLCYGHAATQEGKCINCWINMTDPRVWCGATPTRSVATPSIQTGSILPAFGEVIIDMGAPRGELDSRGSSPLDLPKSKHQNALDDNEASQRGDTVAPTTDGEGEDDGDGETDAGPEEIFYNVDPALTFAVPVPLPEDGGAECQGDGDGGSDYQGDSTDVDEEDEEEKSEAEWENSEEEPEGATAEPNEGEPVTDNEEDEEDNEEDSTDTPVGFSSFRHPDAPTHHWISAATALQMIMRGVDANGRVTPAASTNDMMTVFPRAQRMIQLSDERWKCRATARINRETMDWEEFACDGLSYKNKNDLRRHFTQKHLGDERAEKRCTKRKLDDEENPQPSLPATKRARRR